MATYVLPQVLVFQEFELAAEAATQPLNAFIFGGHAYLVRYSDSSEKLLASIGMYDDTGTSIDGEFKTCYSWPTKPAGAVVDPDYTKLFIDNALLRYFHDTSDTATKEAANKLRLPSTALIDNPDDPDTYPHAVALKDRGAVVGDAVKIIGDDGSGGDPVTLFTYIKSFEADVVAAVTGASAADSGNHATQILSTTNSANGGNSGDATIGSVSGASYNGHPTGDIDETYTITVTDSSTGGDATTATLQVVSASGRDDDAAVTPAAFGSPTSIGARGLTVTWSGGSTEFTAGDEWTVIVHQAFTAPTHASSGTYTGDSDKTYIIEVTTGGLFAVPPKITVTTTDGTDFSGPTSVTASATPVAVGTKGVMIAFTGTALHKGDIYTIAATAAKDGNYKTLVLGHNIQSDIDSNFEVSLYIKKNIEVGKEHIAIDGQYNWGQSATEFCALAGIQAYDSSYTDGGDPVALDVVTETDWTGTNKMYLEYRAWRNDLADTVRSISDTGDLDTAISGALTPDNPLKWGVYKALQNSNGQEVKYMAVADVAETADWTSVLDAIEERTDVYGLVPLTRDATILGLCQAHVDAQSTETAGRWRVLWVNTKVDSVVVVASAANSSDNEIIEAVTSDDPDTSGTQYTIVTVPSNNALFETNGVRAGDTVRYQYTLDSFGNTTYSEYVIDAVINESTLRLVTGTATAVTARKMEVWRSLSVAEQATAIATASGNWANRRIRAVWPDEFEGDGLTQEGYFLCAALSGLTSGVVPQQGLTNLEISGVTGVSRTTDVFNKSQLDEIAVAGGWIVTQNPKSGEVYSRHALTTADYSNINYREENVTRNVDSISYYFLDVFSPYIGVSNVTPGMLDIIEAETLAGVQFLRSSNFTPRLGGQMIDATITDLRISPVFRDRILLSLDVTIPYPLNVLEMHLLI